MPLFFCPTEIVNNIAQFIQKFLRALEIHPMFFLFGLCSYAYNFTVFFKKKEKNNLLFYGRNRSARKDLRVQVGKKLKISPVSVTM